MSEVRSQKLDVRESLYLDLVRALAAFFVVLDHAPTLYDMPHTPRWGHQAVIIFFVLSGYVISHVSDTREATARAFFVARLARLWSVLIPAMILTVACDGIGRSFALDPRGYASVPADFPIIRVAAILAFLSESWVSIQPLSNGVVWSLCAEFWYYGLFGAWTFVAPGRKRQQLLLLLALIAGFKALLLFPIWLLGVALQRWSAPRRLGTGFATALWIVGLCGTAAILAFHLYTPPIQWMEAIVSPWVFRQLAQDRVFWFDWCMGLLVFAHLFGAGVVARRLPLLPFAKLIRWAAGISFAMYLFHMPLLHLTAAFLPPSMGTEAVLLTLAVIAVTGAAVERSKRWWHRLIDRTLGARLERLVTRVS